MKNIDSPFIEMVNKNHDRAITRDTLEKQFADDRQRYEQKKEIKIATILLVISFIALIYC